MFENLLIFSCDIIYLFSFYRTSTQALESSHKQFKKSCGALSCSYSPDKHSLVLIVSYYHSLYKKKKHIHYKTVTDSHDFPVLVLIVA